MDIRYLKKITESPMKCKNISNQKKFLFFIVICAISLVLHQWNNLRWTLEALQLGYPILCSHSVPDLGAKETNIVFLKTHKTASSTVQNLLFRFAENNNLTVGLPAQSCDHQFCYPRTFQSDFVHPHTRPPNVITNHMRFSKTALKHLMPNDTIYVTILREPASMFESSFTYYKKHCQSFKRVPNGSLETFLDDPYRYYRPEEEDSMYAHNTLTFDLGGDKDRPPTDVMYAKTFVAEVERVFSLVMISEYFDESLVLLRNLLSWDLDDILYIKLNMRTGSSKKSLTPAISAKIRSWNSIDAYLYDHFNATLWRKLSALGPECVSREVQLLQQHQGKLMRDCFGGHTPLSRSSGDIKNKDLRPWKPDEKVDIVGYELPENISHERRELCLKYIIPEIPYTQMLLHSQSQKYLQNHPNQSLQKSHTLQLSQHSQVHPNQSPVPNPQGSKSTSKPADEIKQAVNKSSNNAS